MYSNRRSRLQALRPPIVIAVLSDRGVPHAPSNDALIADATKAPLAALG